MWYQIKHVLKLPFIVYSLTLVLWSSACDLTLITNVTREVIYHAVMGVWMEEGS